MRRKELSDEQVRITVRLPAALYDAVMLHHRFPYSGGTDISTIIRKALEHTVACPERQREEEEARVAREQQWAAYEAKCAADEAERERQHQERLAAIRAGTGRLPTAPHPQAPVEQITLLP